MNPALPQSSIQGSKTLSLKRCFSRLRMDPPFGQTCAVRQTLLLHTRGYIQAAPQTCVCLSCAVCRVKGGQELVAAIQAAKQARLKVGVFGNDAWQDRLGVCVGVSVLSHSQDISVVLYPWRMTFGQLQRPLLRSMPISRRGTGQHCSSSPNWCALQEGPLSAI